MEKGIKALANELRNKILILFLSVFLMNCNNEKKDITGIYVNDSVGEWSMASDTIVIRNYHPQTYLIERRTGFSINKDGIWKPKKYKRENSEGIFDEASGQLQEQKYGRLYSFSQSGDGLVIGKAYYVKLK